MSEELIKKLIFEVIVKAAIDRAVAALPLLGLPVLNPLFTWAVMKIATLIYTELARHVSFALIDLKTKQEREAYEEAVIELKRVQLEVAPEPGELDRAKQKFKDTLRDLIRFRS